MTIRANRDPKFYFRFKLIGLLAVAFALWSLYDGAVTYPNQRERGLAFDKLAKDDRMSEWDQFARDHGWPTEYPGEPKSRAEIATQYVMAVVAGTVGLIMLLVVWRSRGRWIEANDTGITSSWGQSLDFDQVTSLDKKKWRGKGIAKIQYHDGRRTRRFVLDDYKFERPATDAILGQLEAEISTDKIVGGPPESPPDELNAAGDQSFSEHSGQPT
jgi:hypothetical protein